MPVMTRSKSMMMSAPIAPVRLDFTKMKKKPVSPSFVFAPSLVEQLKMSLESLKTNYEELLEMYNDAKKEKEMLKKSKKSVEDEFRQYMNDKTADIANLLGKYRTASVETAKLMDENDKLKKEKATLRAEVDTLMEKHEDIEYEISRRVEAEVKRRSGFRPNYMEGWIR